MGTKGELYFPLNTRVTDHSTNTTYTLVKMLGRGAYAQCFLSVANQVSFALKIVRLADLKSEKVRQKLETEIQIHSSMNHQNIVRMFSSFRSDEYVFMVLELCDRGALDELLKRNGRIKERYVSKFVSQLVDGLKYLHEEKSVVHRDLKLGNIFLDSSLNVKIGDFGLSAYISGDEKRKTVCGTPNYIAPEVLFGKVSGHSFEADIWSLGVIIYTLLIGTPPFQRKKVEEIYRLIERNEYIFPPGNTLSSDAVDLITRLITTNPNDRLTLDEIKRHRFLTQRQNLAYRIYRSILSGTYSIEEPACEYTVFSTPVSAINGVGYVLRSGICGVYYHSIDINVIGGTSSIKGPTRNKRGGERDNACGGTSANSTYSPTHTSTNSPSYTNTYIKNNSFVLVRMNTDSDRKVFVTEEHLIENIPKSMAALYQNIIYFIKKYTRLWPEATENTSNFIPSTSFFPMIDGAREREGAFIAKVKEIKDGMLFVLTNNVFVFDFVSGVRVAVARDGKVIYPFEDDGPVEFTDELKKACVDILRPYCNVR